ncbi:TetR family transcriptional regulator [Pseudoclavibacter endophyticus]|uniref:TetR/AcrR family transcriptional regulator n=1 Tax=Pseudoclavibacter endophyticus TaxID=1778590 RepID=UPI001663D444|nr:TetR/AcrR family transcriptional regulator [Pseudoclavibacter endophyticus]GGA76721.1 TetR family transcriptional regulator [Pseudoclavibacter endophyticus]
MQPSTSLRERNRLATWQLIHDTAAELVLKHGIAAATVEAIAERAGCSRRTFFNYFATKEDAILGMRELRLDPDDVRAIAAAEPAAAPFDRTMRILITILSEIYPVPGRYDRRRALLEKVPELKSRFIENISSAEGLVLEYLRHDAELGDAHEGLGPDIDADEARVLLTLAAAIIRYAATHDADNMLVDRDAALRRATKRFREVIEHTL